jgi:hypothetical protein
MRRILLVILALASFSFQASYAYIFDMHNPLCIVGYYALGTATIAIFAYVIALWKFL